ncbi:hypothetical protein [Bradyrhizobium lablabi]|uniref:hypothetical protein n=1 Tax=Bradyrhizobium lablabi TaxID=722472 RepID=UPI000ADBB185|nr:hypothetical protein [Bradyrhizobium lablabi]
MTKGDRKSHGVKSSETELLPWRPFNDRPTGIWIEETVARIKGTAQPELIESLYRNPIPKDARFRVLKHLITVDGTKRPKGDNCPCPMCTPNRFLTGSLVWFTELQCCAFIGNCCANDDVGDNSPQADVGGGQCLRRGRLGIYLRHERKAAPSRGGHSEGRRRKHHQVQGETAGSRLFYTRDNAEKFNKFFAHDLNSVYYRVEYTTTRSQPTLRFKKGASHHDLIRGSWAEKLDTVPSSGGRQRHLRKV